MVSSLAASSLPKCERIRKRTEYLSVQGCGRKLHSDNFLVFVLKRPSEEGAAKARVRFGTTVTKKVGGAVVRNRVKRMVRETYRQHKSWFPAGADVVLVAKRSAAGLRLRDVEREIERLCARAFCQS